MFSPLSWGPLRAMPWRQAGWGRLAGAGAGRAAMGPGSSGAPAWSVAGGTRISEKLRAIERTRSADVELRITTDEGDTVTLSIHDELDLTAISYRYRTRGPDGKTSANLDALQLSRSHEIQMQVDGSLNAEELAAVNQLLDQVERSVQVGLASGSIVSFAGLAASDADPSLDPLSGYQLDVRQSDTVEAVILKLRQWVPQSDGPILSPADREAEPLPVASLFEGDTSRRAEPLLATRPTEEWAATGRPLVDRVKALLDLIHTLPSPAQAA